MIFDKLYNKLMDSGKCYSYKEILQLAEQEINELYPQNNTQDTPLTSKSKHNSSYIEGKN